ncbi:hypothetical protein CYMTET_24441 [Cymbomonas tetramitiformis]|uniref:Uncharacterized protein n=1 Tax=Cymbomonas tetramitiformis TaxID=36881 RepID=A0AAE0L028_9CHLO|nr:hypothetical protein CYMTET_24441 [Cymbomonas tetramitiformis]
MQRRAALSRHRRSSGEVAGGWGWVEQRPLDYIIDLLREAQEGQSKSQAMPPGSRQTASAPTAESVERAAQAAEMMLRLDVPVGGSAASFQQELRQEARCARHADPAAQEGGSADSSETAGSPESDEDARKERWIDIIVFRDWESDENIVGEVLVKASDTSAHLRLRLIQELNLRDPFAMELNTHTLETDADTHAIPLRPWLRGVDNTLVIRHMPPPATRVAAQVQSLHPDENKPWRSNIQPAARVDLRLERAARAGVVPPSPAHYPSVAETVPLLSNPVNWAEYSLKNAAGAIKQSAEGAPQKRLHKGYAPLNSLTRI